jgi:hypothetical protein
MSSVKTSDMHSKGIPRRQKRPGQCSRYTNSLQAGRSGVRNLVAATYFLPDQTGPGAHTISHTMSVGLFPGGTAAGAWR